jgi:hypothetical protein
MKDDADSAIVRFAKILIPIITPRLSVSTVLLIFFSAAKGSTASI